MLISHKSKKIFISIPKTGSTSIMFLLNEKSIHYKPNIYHASFKEIQNFDNSLLFNNDLVFSGSFSPFNFFINDINNYSIFSVIREPIERLISVYYDARLDKNHDTLRDISLCPDLNNFFEFYFSINVFDHPRHLWPQNFFIDGVKSNNLKLYSFKNIQKCYEKLIGIKIFKYKKLPHLRNTNSSNISHKINSNIIKKLQKDLRDDYKLYNSLEKISL